MIWRVLEDFYGYIEDERLMTGFQAHPMIIGVCQRFTHYFLDPLHHLFGGRGQGKRAVQQAREKRRKGERKEKTVRTVTKHLLREQQQPTTREGEEEQKNQNRNQKQKKKEKERRRGKRGKRRKRRRGASVCTAHLTFFSKS